jgi:hypothetical protein
MIFEDIYKDIFASFGTLWKFKERDKSLEIITPYATTSRKFISVFLTKREGVYIVSDGGWVASGNYENTFFLDKNCFTKLYNHYISSFNIKTVITSKRKADSNNIHFYKTSENAIAIPALVFDIANFISAVVSASEIEFTKDDDEVDSKRFRATANNFLTEIVSSERVDTNGYLDAKHMIRVSAIITKPQSKLVLVNYISGSNSYLFTNSVARANLMFEMSEKSHYKENIENKISLVNDASLGYRIDSSRLLFALENRHSVQINWSQKENLIEYLN